MISTLTILTVLFLPLPIICKLQVSGAKKVGLAISFTVGALYVTSLAVPVPGRLLTGDIFETSTCIASVIRIIVVLRTDAEDLTCKPLSRIYRQHHRAPFSSVPPRFPHIPRTLVLRRSQLRRHKRLPPIPHNPLPHTPRQETQEFPTAQPLLEQAS